MSLLDRVRSFFSPTPNTGDQPAFPATPFPSGEVEAPQQNAQELGGTGTSLWSGFIRGEDYLGELEGPQGVRNLDQMRRSDGMVNATLQVCTLPVQSAACEIDAAGASGDAAVQLTNQQATDFVEWNLFHGMTIDWDDVVRQALLMLPFGFMLFEKIWTIVEDGPWKGYVALKKLAPRPPKTIWQWFPNENGELLSVKQLAIKAGTYQFLDIPASKLVRFTFRQEGDNYQGISLLRTAYKHWKIKDALYKADAIRGYRYGVGIPRAKVQKDVRLSTDERDELIVHLENMVSHDQSYLIQPYGVDVDILTPQGGSQGGVEVLPSIEHHDRAIAVNVLAQFLDYGKSQSGGNRALGQTATQFFQNAEEAIAKYFCGVINKQVIPDLVDRNFAVTGYPTMRMTGIKETNIDAIASAYEKLASSGGIVADQEIQDTNRTLLGYPPRPDASASATAGPVEAPGLRERRHRAVKLAAGTFWRRPTALEERVLDLREMPAHLNTQRDALVAHLKSIRAEQIARFAGEVARIPGAIDPGKVRVPLVGKMESDLIAAMGRVFDYGTATVAHELRRQQQGIKAADALALAAPASATAAKPILRSSARISAQTAADRLKATALNVALRMKRAGQSPADIETALRRDLAGLSDGDLLHIANAEINEAFALGRNAAAHALQDAIEYCVYSAILDANTCDVCQECDGEELEIDSPRYNEVLPPNPNCDGRDNCRCVVIYVAKASDDGSGE